MSAAKGHGHGGEWGGRGRFAAGLNVSTSVVLALVVFLAVNYISARHLYYRTDISGGRFLELSGKTVRMLEGLNADISVYVIFKDEDDDESAVLPDIMNLMKEYRHLADSIPSLSIKVERVDPGRDPVRTEELHRRFGLQRSNVVMFESGGRSRSVLEGHIVDYRYESSPMDTGSRRKKTMFRGEQAFSSAILGVTQDRRPVIYFVRGHGEHDTGDYAQYVGYSEIARSLYLDNMDVRSISLTERQGIPTDCDLLAIAGPRQRFHESEVEAVGDYLRAGRNLLLLVDAGTETGLELVMEEWRVRLPRRKVVEKTYVMRVSENKLVQLPGTGEELYVSRYGEHAVTRGLDGLTTVFYMPRAVVPVSEPDSATAESRVDRPHGAVLFSSSENSWAESDPEQDPPRYDGEVDSVGPVPLAVAVERGPADSANVEMRPMRIVVVGDSDFVANERMSGGNRDLFMNAVNWLLERETLIAVGPKTYETRRLEMDDGQIKWVFVIVVLVMPLAVAMFGIAAWLKRVR